MLTMSIDKDYYVYNYGSRSVRWTGKSDRVPKITIGCRVSRHTMQKT